MVIFSRGNRILKQHNCTAPQQNFSKPNLESIKRKKITNKRGLFQEFKIGLTSKKSINAISHINKFKKKSNMIISDNAEELL
jgi:hypothetical protein